MQEGMQTKREGKTMTQYESKIFDTETLQGLKAAERYQNRLYNKYERVEVKAIGLTRVQVIGRVRSN